jgi:hypothetical protein
VSARPLLLATAQRLGDSKLSQRTSYSVGYFFGDGHLDGSAVTLAFKRHDERIVDGKIGVDRS